MEANYDPFLTTMLIVAEADKFLAQEEVMVILKQVNEQRLFLPPNKVSEVVNAILKHIREVGIDEMIQWTASKITSTQGRITAYRCALAVAEADDRLAAEELAVLSKLKDAFGLSDDEIEQITTD